MINWKVTVCSWFNIPPSFLYVAYLLGLLAMIKCSICSYQCDNWYTLDWGSFSHLYFSRGVCRVQLAGPHTQHRASSSQPQATVHPKTRWAYKVSLLPIQNPLKILDYLNAAVISERTNLSPFTKGCRDLSALHAMIPNFWRATRPTVVQGNVGVNRLEKMTCKRCRKLRNWIPPEAAGILNLPGWRWARIKQLALVGWSSSLHSEVCKIPGLLFGDATAKFLWAATQRTLAVANKNKWPWVHSGNSKLRPNKF